MAEQTNDKKEARTYEEIALSPEVIQRGVDLVAPLSRILLRRAKDVKVFHGRTTDSEWEAFEKEFDVSIPQDFKLLTNTVGTLGLWLNGRVCLQSPATLGKRIKELQDNYHTWQLEGDAHQRVSVWPNQPAFHMEWGIDYEGNALSFFWVCAKESSGDNNNNNKAGWPIVQLELEAPLRHNSSVYPCTVTEMLYRDVTNNGGMGEYDDDDEEDEGEEEEESEFEKVVLKDEEGNDRRVFMFSKNGEPPKSKAKIADDGDIGDVGSEQDKKDMAMLEGAEDFEPIQHGDVEKVCKAMEPLVVKAKSNDE